MARAGQPKFSVPNSLISDVAEIVGDARLAKNGNILKVRPASVEDLCRVVALTTSAGVAVLSQSHAAHYAAPVMSAVVDTADLNGIAEINEPDRYVTVETGCTWAALYDALKAKGLRTPFFGPLSGAASIGETADNNAAFFGSGQYGAMSDNVLGLDVVLADGSLVETGAAAAEGRTPFFRHFGPDLTGLFLGDCGAFGVKARITLPLIPFPAVEDYLSFSFERFEDLAEAHIILARENIVTEQWGIDPDGNDALAAQGFRALDGVAFLREVEPVKHGMGQHVATIARTLVEGDRAYIRGGYSLHVVVDGTAPKDVELRIGQVRRLLVPLALKEVPAALPQAVRAKPFETGARILSGMMSAQGQRSIAVHGVFPLSRAVEISAITDEYFVRHRDIMKTHRIRVTILTSTIERAYMIAPTFVWPEASVAGASAVARLRHDLALLWGAFGASHFEVGSFYTYSGALSTAAAHFITALKAAADPKGLMNPGALRLGEPVAPSKTKFAEFPQNVLDNH